MRKSALAVVLGTALLASSSVFAETVITVDAGKQGAKIDPRLYGIFLEEIGHGVDGGLYAEMIQNRGFEDAKAPEGFTYQQGRARSGFRGQDAAGGHWSDPGGYTTTFVWQVDKSLPYWSLLTKGGGQGTMSLDMAKPLNEATPRSCKLVISMLPEGGRVAIANEGFCAAQNSSAIGIKEGERYELSFWARGEGFGGPLTASVESVGGVAETDVAKIEGITGEWKQYHATITASKTDAAGRFVLAAGSKGTVWFDMVSLFPAKTFKDRPNGLRTDIAQMIADMKPGFVRFPGGCVVEAATVETAYNWKNTLGPVEQRPECWNAWDYRRTHGMGIFEYLQFIEDIGATPMWVGFAGQTCVYRAPEVVPMDKMQPIVDAFTDLADYANGAANTKYGKMRVDSGHEKPFNLKLMEIGNENNGQAYAQRYPLVYQAIKAKHPEIQTIANEPVGRSVEMIDEHHYADPNWFLNNNHLYDKSDRNTPIYLGEVAVTQGATVPLERGTLQAALAEGTYLMGAERNADVVKMVSYAPLLGYYDPRGRSELAGAPPVWHAMIYFDSIHSFGTASYYLWKTFGLNRPSVNLDTTVVVAGAKNAIMGNVGVGTWGTTAEFKDIKVEKEGKTLYASDFTKGAADWKVDGGRWAVQGDAYRETGNGTPCLSYVGDETWTDYTLTLKARKLTGNEGFLIVFGHKGGDRFWWNLGGWGNNDHGLELNGGAASPQVRGNIVANQWYDIKIEVAGTHIKASLDGKLIHDAVARLPDPMSVVAGRDDATGEIVIKAINATEQATASTINLKNAGTVATEGTMTVLTSARVGDNNSLTVPTKVVPVTTTISGLGATFTHEFPAHSLTVLRMKAK